MPQAEERAHYAMSIRNSLGIACTGPAGTETDTRCSSIAAHCTAALLPMSPSVGANNKAERRFVAAVRVSWSCVCCLQKPPLSSTASNYPRERQHDGQMVTLPVPFAECLFESPSPASSPLSSFALSWSAALQSPPSSRTLFTLFTTR